MKNTKHFCLVLLFLSSISVGQSLQLMTYNLRYDNEKDGANKWDNRKEFLLSQIKYFEPDILGTQEGLTHQIKWINENLSNYKYEGIGREGLEKGEYSAIFYNSDKFTVVESKTFWLSETPYELSKGWDAAQFRVCTYALFKEFRSGKKFFVFNTHFDHKGDIARVKSAELILKEINRINSDNLPCFLMGDFNLTPDQSPIQKIKEVMFDSRMICSTVPYGPEETFSDFDICKPPVKRIDYIFVDKRNISVTKYATLVNIQDTRYPSDHYPVIINCQIKN